MDELRKVIKEAFRNGPWWREGRRDGYDEGHETGYQEGLEEKNDEN